MARKRPTEKQAQSPRETLRVESSYGSLPTGTNPPASPPVAQPQRPRPSGGASSDTEMTPPVQTRDVIGPDNRVRVHNTHEYPWRTICALRIIDRNNREYIGTGAMVGRRTVLTAAHCLYFHDSGGLARVVHVTPGLNGSQTPFGSVPALEFSVVDGWIATGDTQFDYGAIFLPAPLGNQVGTLGFASLSAEKLATLTVNNAGYPEKMPAAGLPSDPPAPTTLWWNSSGIKRVDETRIFYTMDTFRGHSGSPVWHFDQASDQRQIVGIHTTGSEASNSATRVSPFVFENVRRWAARS